MKKIIKYFVTLSTSRAPAADVTALVALETGAVG